MPKGRRRTSGSTAGRLRGGRSPKRATAPEHVGEVVTDMEPRRSANCPDWCFLPHCDGSLISHESRSIAVPVVSRNDGVEVLKVRTVQYLTEDSHTDDAVSERAPFVEVAHHVEGRYTLISLSVVQARALAQALLRGADAAENPTRAGSHPRQHS